MPTKVSKARARRKESAALSRRNPNDTIESESAKATTDHAIAPLRTRRRSRRLSLLNDLALASPAMPPAATTVLRPLLVAAIGNPRPYAETLHSAAFAALDEIRGRRGFVDFLPSRQLGGGGCQVATSPYESGWTLWMSGSFMNVSGAAVSKAWKGWDERHRGGVLVVVHDELERDLGRLSVRWSGSPRGRGHKGLKSIQTTLPNTRYARIGIGIGRPASREPRDVSRYVLRKMNPDEEDAIRDAGCNMIELLRDIAEGDESNRML